MEHNDLLGEIVISPNNTMKARYSVMGVDNFDTLAEIEVRVRDHTGIVTNIRARVFEDNNQEVEIDVKYSNSSEVFAEIQPIGYNTLPAEINIRPGNRMWGLFEVQEPTRITNILNPTKDSLTREREEYQSINYGSNHSLTVGSFENDRYQTFIKFNLHNWNPYFVITSSTLRLHYSRTIPAGTELSFYTLSREWSEYGITHLNSPTKVRLISDQFINHSEHGYIEIDFTEITEEWVKNPESDYGFLIETPTINQSSGIATFRSRESQRPPELEVTYFDAQVYSSGRSQIPTEIFVWKADQYCVLTEIEVGSVVTNSDPLTEIYVHRHEEPVPDDKVAIVVINKPHTESEITVGIRKKDSIPTQINARSESISNSRKTEITVSKNYQFAEIWVKNREGIEAEIKVRRKNEVDAEAGIVVTREQAESEIFVKFLNITKAEIEVQRYSSEDTLSEITVSKDRVYTEISSRVLEDSTRESEIYIRAVKNSSIYSEVTVTKKQVHAEITVSHYIDTQAEVFVKYGNNVDTAIVVTVFSQLFAEIDVIGAIEQEVEITVSKPSTLALITVPFWDDSEILVDIRPRILRVSDINTEIVIDKTNKGGAYAFII